MQKENEDIDILVSILRSIRHNIWIIVWAMVISGLIAFIKLKFTPSIYSAYSTIKVSESEKKGGEKSDELINQISTFKIKSIGEHIELMKSYYMNSKALSFNSDIFKIQYFQINGYIPTEIFQNIPIRVDDIEVFNQNIKGKRILLTPNGDSFTLKIEHPITERIRAIVSEDESMQFADREFRFGEQISTKYFKCKIDKLSNFNYPIMVIFNIDNRYIYDAVIKQNLSVQQLDNGYSQFIKIGI